MITDLINSTSDTCMIAIRFVPRSSCTSLDKLSELLGHNIIWSAVASTITITMLLEMQHWTEFLTSILDIKGDSAVYSCHVKNKAHCSQTEGKTSDILKHRSAFVTDFYKVFYCHMCYMDLISSTAQKCKLAHWCLCLPW